jgi:FkbM family methyltransferase
MKMLVSDVHGLPILANKRAILVCREAEIEEAVRIAYDRAKLQISCVCLWDENFKFYNNLQNTSVKNALSQSTWGNFISILNGNRIDDYPELFISVYVGDFSKIIYRKIRISLGQKGIYSFSIFNSFNTPMEINVNVNKFTKFYHTHKKRLEEMYQSFEDFESKDVFARHIKARLTGDLGYIRMSLGQHYFHEKARVQPGDIVVDAGVSSNIAVIKNFAQWTGPAGKVFGFEPVKRHWDEASRRISEKTIDNVEIIRAGLWSSERTERILVHHRGASKIILKSDESCEAISPAPNDYEMVPLVTLDRFLKARGQTKLDVLKMDIEGAELEALKGAERAIRHNKPLLIICVYHKPKHLFQLPEYIKSIHPEYQFFLRPFSWSPSELVLFAKHPERASSTIAMRLLSFYSRSLGRTFKTTK